MRQETNNEIDLLLRRLSRRQDIATPDAALRVDGDHLDADELSSYAENVLPAAARARYTEHLAECASCRKLVAQLSSSVGPAGVQDVSRAAEPSALRRFLASLFSPMVLRYAVPALGLIVVAVIGFVALRQEERAATDVSLVRQQEDAGVPASQTAESESVVAHGQLNSGLEKSESTAATPKGGDNKTRETQSRDTQTAAAAGSGSGAKTDERPPAKEPQPVANIPAAPSQAVAVADEKRKTETEARKQAAEGPPVAPGSEVSKGYESARTVDRRSEDVAAARPAPARAKALESRAARGGGETFQLGRAEEKDRDGAETRSVAGRRFRKSGGKWIDTAYDSSQATVNLTRGSEQYRALVADEPAIKSIAEQLDGEIIVVWKGRAYRIR